MNKMKKNIAAVLAGMLLCTAVPNVNMLKNAEAAEGPSVSTLISKKGSVHTFTVTPANTENGNNIVLALYNSSKELTDVQLKKYDGGAVKFTSEKPYDSVKVMMWDSMDKIKPVCSLGNVEKENVIVKVMPLGDSITDGFTVNGGYRKTLESKIQTAKLSANVDFVGSDKNDNGTYDGDHEGHSGWAIDAIPISSDIEGKGRQGLTSNVDSWMSTYNPDIVMLMIGTNDILSQYDLDNAPARLSKLVDKVIAKLPEDGTLYLATIPYLKAGGNYDKTGKTQAVLNEQIDAYNTGVKAIAQEKGLVLVDVNSLLSISDLSDVAHPTSSGYAKLGNLWYDTIIGELNERINW